MSTSPDGFRRLTTRGREPSWTVDLLVTGVLLVMLFVVTRFTFGVVSGLMSILASLLMVGAMALRRHSPLLMLLIVSAGALVLLVTSRYPQPAVFVVPLAAYSVARWVPGRASRLVPALGLAGAVLASVRWQRWLISSTDESQLTHGVWLLLLTILLFGLVATPYAIGRRVLASVQMREQQQAAREERAERDMSDREQLARIAEAAARAQIARELHDIVAHSLSVIIVQAEGGKALAARKPEAAAQALGTIAETGRDALGEMRRIVSVLRDGPASTPEYVPTPGLDDIPDLVAKSGHGVHLDIVGDPPRVPQTLGLTAYRVVQEALTNVIRHAGPDAQAQVLLSYSPALVVVEVADDGRGAASAITSSDGQGNGLRGMRERVTSMGGQLVARPRSGGGFLVRALLPVVDSHPEDAAQAGLAPAGEPPRALPPAPGPSTRSAPSTSPPAALPQRFDPTPPTWRPA